MTENKRARIVSYTLWLENEHEEGKLTFSRRADPDAVWESPTEIKQGDGTNNLSLTESGADWFMKTQGFTVKEVIE